VSGNGKNRSGLLSKGVPRIGRWTIRTPQHNTWWKTSRTKRNSAGQPTELVGDSPVISRYLTWRALPKRRKSLSYLPATCRS